MRKILSCLLTTAFAFSLSMTGACRKPIDDCDYDKASEICQQAYDCCNQFLNYYEQTGNPLADQLDCEGYTCMVMLDEVCDQFIDQAVAAEEAYSQDWPDCH